ncbi:hypothetical protein ONZ45_g8385 [Pleurotus djamor]|nr:hypothetical protein ONZ45_g8385 [Pleurotus djamor]
MRASDKASSQEIRITAVETDGDNRMDLWPTQFFARILHEQPNLLHDLQAWIRRNNPPLCTFMADRLRDPNANTVNQANFRSLSRVLFETQTVAIAAWNTDKIDGAGMIIYPSPNSSALLVGALFLYTPFPDFILSPAPVSPGSLVSPSASRHHHYPASSYTSTSSSSSAATSAARHRHPDDQYRYIMPRTTVPSNAPTTADPWSPAVKSEDEASYSHAHHHHHYPPPH